MGAGLTLELGLASPAYAAPAPSLPTCTASELANAFTTNLADGSGGTLEGGSVSATVNVPASCAADLDLVSYWSQYPTFAADNGANEVVMDQDPVSAGTGTVDLTVPVAACDYAVDLVTGTTALTGSDFQSGQTYSGQGRLLDSWSGGDAPCGSAPYAGSPSGTTCPNGSVATVSGVTYTLSNGGTTVASGLTQLRGQTAPGETVTADFTVPANTPCDVTASLESYYSQAGTYSNAAFPQSFYAGQTGTFGPGSYSLSVPLPDCYYQVDFFYGALNSDFNGELVGGASGLSADNGGTTACTSTTPAPAPAPSTPAPTAGNTTPPTVTPPTSPPVVTTPTPVAAPVTAPILTASTSPAPSPVVATPVTSVAPVTAPAPTTAAAGQSAPAATQPATPVLAASTTSPARSPFAPATVAPAPVAPAPVVAATPAPAPSSLPFTGSNPEPLAGSSLGLIGAGLFVRRLSRRVGR